MSEIVHVRGQPYQVGEGVCEPQPLPAWFPEVLPSGWGEHPAPYGWDRDYTRVYERHGTVRVLVTCAVYNDGKRWLHVSVSRKNRQIPTWDLMSEVKDLFLGPERTALQVHPPRSRHVNIHPGVLHLWHCLDGDVTPDFAAGGETI
jgi:hypothetical protein